MSRMTLGASLIALCLAAGCAGPSPDRAEVRWSDQAPVVQPIEETPVNRGWLRVKTAHGARHQSYESGFTPWHRGYAIFDDKGQRIYSCDGHAEEEDRIALKPGRYIVVGRIDDGTFGRELVTAQVVIAANKTTIVDVAQRQAGKADSPGS